MPLSLTPPPARHIAAAPAAASSAAPSAAPSAASGTDFYPSSKSVAETILVTCLVLIGAILWTQILALFCDVRACPTSTLQPPI